MSDSPAQPPAEPKVEPAPEAPRAETPSAAPPPATPSAAPPRVAPSSRPPMSGGADLFGGVDRVARIQTILAVVLGLALIAIPLYLWRRPRSESLPVTSALDASAPVGDAGVAVAAAAVPAPAAGPVVTLSDPKVMECHDTGSHRTRPEDCDHLVALEKGLAAAITAGGPCLPTASGGGTLVYVLDASFNRKHRPFELFVPKDGRSLKNARGAAAAVSACSAAVKRGVDGLSLDGIQHAHSRYKIAITATYAAAPGSGP